MIVSLANVTPEQLRMHDIIEAVDAKQPSYRRQVYGQGVPAMARLPGTGPHLMQTLEVQIDSDSDAELQDLKGRVKAAKGWLHPVVEALKK
jgi:hypothetical protein